MSESFSGILRKYAQLNPQQSAAEFVAERLSDDGDNQLSDAILAVLKICESLDDAGWWTSTKADEIVCSLAGIWMDHPDYLELWS